MSSFLLTSSLLVLMIHETLFSFFFFLEGDGVRVRVRVRVET
jgi:hypothetical protein